MAGRLLRGPVGGRSRANLRRMPLPIFPKTLRPSFCRYAEEFPKPHLTAFNKLCRALMDGSLSDDEESAPRGAVVDTLYDFFNDPPDSLTP